MNRLRGYLSLAVLVGVTLPLLPLQALARRRNWRLAATLPCWWHRFALRRLDVNVTIHSELAADRPLLIVANHSSWLDIPVVASLAPLSFVAKSDVNDWPVFGLFARLQRSIFVDRSRRQDAARTASEMAARMSSGDAIVLFAEGTTSDGNRVLPFRSALLGAARAAIVDGGHDRVLVQPLSVAYTCHHGLPLGRQGRAYAAWPGDLDLLPHLLDVVRGGALDVEVRFGRPRAYDAATDRKALTAQLEADVRAMHQASLNGYDSH
jgi:1-acyl-sn-glycerol-3-phosphate acyltransferase